MNIFLSNDKTLEKNVPELRRPTLFSYGMR